MMSVGLSGRTMYQIHLKSQLRRSLSESSQNYFRNEVT